MYTLEITASAESDIDQITDYIGNELANPSAALAFLDEVERVSDTLEETPELFPLCADSRLAELGRNCHFHADEEMEHMIARLFGCGCSS